MSGFRIGLMSVLFSLSGSIGSWAQSPGPLEGPINLVGVAGNNLLAFTKYKGAFLSSDNGETWRRIPGEALTGEFVDFHSAGEYSLVAGVSKLLRSTDDGMTWTDVKKEQSMPEAPYTDFFQDDAVIYLASYGSIYRSSDTGVSWETLKPDLSLPRMSIATKKDTIFTSLFFSGISRSVDGGQTWEMVNNGLAEEINSNANFPMVFIADSIVFAGTSNGVFRSVDNGENWKRSKMDSDRAGGFEIFSMGPRLLLATKSELHYSDDQGEYWIRQTNIPKVYSFAAKGTVVFAGTESGVIRSPDSGKTWLPTGTKVVGVHPGVNGFREYGIDPIPGGVLRNGQRVSFKVPARASVDLRLYHASGKLVKSLLHSESMPGNRNWVDFEAGGLPEGIYFLSLRFSSSTFSRRVLLTQ